MEAVVHIGLPKTGTTGIQRALMLNRAMLKREGFLFLPYHGWLKSQPEYTVLGFERANRQLPRGLVRDLTGTVSPKRQTRYCERFERWLDGQLAGSNAHTFIISSEFISIYSRPDALRALVAWLQARFTRVRFVLFLREQVDLIIGGYSEELRYAGCTKDLAAYSRDRKPLDLLKWVNVLENTVGRENLAVEIMDPANPTPLLTRFCLVAGLPELAVPTKRLVNKSLTDRGAKCMVAINRYLNRLPLPRTLLIPVRAGLGVLCERATSGGPRLALNEVDRARIRDQVAATNEKLRRCRFPDRPSLFSAPPGDATAQKPPSEASN